MDIPDSIEHITEDKVAIESIKVRESRVDEVNITEIAAPSGVKIEYPQGYFLRVDQSQTQLVCVKGSAYYVDGRGVRHPSTNACILGKIEDQQWKEIHRPDMSTVESAAIVNSGGSYKMYFNLNTALGGLKYNGPTSTHYYDFMEATVHPEDNANITDVDYFYYLKFSDIYGPIL